jgi:hypothetical protein
MMDTANLGRHHLLVQPAIAAAVVAAGGWREPQGEMDLAS